MESDVERLEVKLAEALMENKELKEKVILLTKQIQGK